MKKKVELPLTEPIYSTYHSQGGTAAAIYTNPSIRNWYLNQVMILSCGRNFLHGVTTPQLHIEDSKWQDNPYFEQCWYGVRFARGYINYVIREMLDHGYYIYFGNADDFYIKGKTWYNERHLRHDGLITGYDQEEKTYTIYAYDINWIYRKFKTPQSCFIRACVGKKDDGIKGTICAIKPKPDIVEFRPDIVHKKLKEYLNSSFELYPPTETGTPVFGIVVHDYLALYMDRLMEGLVPYERMDYRIFRLIWEHKKAMLERLQKMEKELKMSSAISDEYAPLVKMADDMRMLYAVYHRKRRDDLLPIIRKKLLTLKAEEQRILTEFVNETEGLVTL